ncbi:hypothetical protein MQX03_06715 [Chryseobacterium aahli]|uniref:hypothetical protein n=1 Tax=Chryseobacterium aahli TaxID=1278643 RepID=UPI001F61DD05|nr:hypothetical protein [Chryseobacterium aahli]MCI3936885.1 hypothetical protein [Chryseobacterium aahli]
MNFKLIEVAIGLIFVYLLLSIFAMVFMEMISTFLRMRGELLKSTIEKMLFNKNENPEKINKFYDQPLVLFLGDDVTTWSFLDRFISKKFKKLPSYLKCEDFYNTFLTFINDEKFSDSLTVIEAKISAAPFAENTKSHLRFLIQKSKGDVVNFKKEISAWFEECMARANTWYSRKVQYILLFLGFVIAVSVNGDTLRMIQKLNNDEKLRNELVQSASDYIKENPDAPKAKTDVIKKKIGEEYNSLISESHQLLGWEKNLDKKYFDDHFDFQNILSKFFGFLLTAVAISLGSNFWFDLLKRLLNIRTLGKPTQINQ